MAFAGRGHGFSKGLGLLLAPWILLGGCRWAGSVPCHYQCNQGGGCVIVSGPAVGGGQTRQCQANGGVYAVACGAAGCGGCGGCGGVVSAACGGAACGASSCGGASCGGGGGCGGGCGGCGG